MRNYMPFKGGFPEMCSAIVIFRLNAKVGLENTLLGHVVGQNILGDDNNNTLCSAEP